MTSQLTTNIDNKAASSNHRFVHKNYLFCEVYKAYRQKDYFTNISIVLSTQKDYTGIILSLSMKAIIILGATYIKIELINMNLINYHRQNFTTKLCA